MQSVAPAPSGRARRSRPGRQTAGPRAGPLPRPGGPGRPALNDRVVEGRERPQDDLVLAVAVATWKGERPVWFLLTPKEPVRTPWCGDVKVPHPDSPPTPRLNIRRSRPMLPTPPGG